MVPHRISAAAMASSKLDSNDAQELNRGVKVNTSPLTRRRVDWSSRMQRSCSVDALNQIDDDTPLKPVGEQTPELQMRRCSTEASCCAVK